LKTKKQKHPQIAYNIKTKTKKKKKKKQLNLGMGGVVTACLYTTSSPKPSLYLYKPTLIETCFVDDLPYWRHQRVGPNKLLQIA
jgi:hypothetical protein